MHYPIPLLGDPPFADGSHDLSFGFEACPAPPLPALQTYTGSFVETRGFRRVFSDEVG
jgi:hypothetical protein